MPLLLLTGLSGLIAIVLGLFNTATRRKPGAGLVVTGAVMVGAFLFVLHDWDTTMRRVWQIPPASAPQPATSTSGTVTGSDAR